MNSLNAVNPNGSMPQIKKISTQTSFNGTTQAVSEEKSALTDLGLKVGLAVAAAVGIGFAIKNGKAAKVAQEASEKLQGKVDDLQKASNEMAESMQRNLDNIANDANNIATRTAKKAVRDAKVKALQAAGIKDELSDTLSRFSINDTNIVRVYGKTGNDLEKVVVFAPDGKTISKIYEYKYDVLQKKNILVKTIKPQELVASARKGLSEVLGIFSENPKVSGVLKCSDFVYGGDNLVRINLPKNVGNISVQLDDTKKIANLGLHIGGANMNLTQNELGSISKILSSSPEVLDDFVSKMNKDAIDATDATDAIKNLLASSGANKDDIISIVKKLGNNMDIISPGTSQQEMQQILDELAKV